MRCEDFPCCGHSIGECPIGEAKECPDCGKSFLPTSENFIYCYRCSKTPKFSSREDRDDFYDLDESES